MFLFSTYPSPVVLYYSFYVRESPRLLRMQFLDFLTPYFYMQQAKCKQVQAAVQKQSVGID